MQNVSAIPNSFKINANSEQMVLIKYKPKETGILKGLLVLKIDGYSFQKTIDLNGTSVEFNR